MLSPGLRALMARADERGDRVRYGRTLELIVDRPEARFAAWYEMFPRSQGRVPGRSASFDDCIERLGEIAALGFDVVYLVPIHPIGRTNRKGRDNAVVAAPQDPGSPYAIGGEGGGGEAGGHRAVHPELGTLDDFRRFVAAAAGLGIEVALDFAVQCAPDHPWVREHKEWFRWRPDGSIRYAENPPKTYEDIVNVDFDNPDREGLWSELRDTVLFWIDQGVRIFRVDNPHTKPVPFWEWLIREVKARCPEAVFLAEAFTRPKMMRALAKAGFTQSYTYFTWRNTKAELIEYLTELTEGPATEYFRPNFFTNTPDILPVFLQEGGRPAFRIRLVLAGTLSPAYGIYNGFELCENRAIPGREEYLHSEKYEYKVWDWDRPGNIKRDIRVLNRFRRDNPALHEFANLRFLDCADPNILAYAKATADRGNIVIAVVNLDPHGVHAGEIILPLDALGLAPDQEFSVEEAFTGRVLKWRGARQHLALDPQANPALLFRLLSPGDGRMTPPDDAPAALLPDAAPLAQPAAGDPLWYKDAIIYQLHVKAFFDANNDGIGDFEGLSRKLDYLEGLGVTALWLLPFYPSPLRDDGYDIAGYRDIHPTYGRMADFRAFIRAAHRRNMRVITELVINHTSDQHPWFQRARRAKPGSPLRDFYVWSDTNQKFLDTRIIFLDTETSNWTWDPVARGLLLASLLFAPARSQFRQSAGVSRHRQRDAFLARSRGRRHAARRRALPDRARRHQQRKPAGNARNPAPAAPRNGPALPRPHAARRGQSMARGRAAIFRRGR